VLWDTVAAAPPRGRAPLPQIVGWVVVLCAVVYCRSSRRPGFMLPARMSRGHPPTFAAMVSWPKPCQLGVSAPRLSPVLPDTMCFVVPVPLTIVSDSALRRVAGVSFAAIVDETVGGFQHLCTRAVPPAAVDDEHTKLKRVERCATLARDCLNYSWEQLHIGQWAAVAPIWREVYGAAALILAACFWIREGYVGSEPPCRTRARSSSQRVSTPHSLIAAAPVQAWRQKRSQRCYQNS
jgi:hypothetical protein